MHSAFGLWGLSPSNEFSGVAIVIQIDPKQHVIILSRCCYVSLHTEPAAIPFNDNLAGGKKQIFFLKKEKFPMSKKKLQYFLFKPVVDSCC
jgi:hypothetical protein